jgi:hypothetical protein
MSAVKQEAENQQGDAKEGTRDYLFRPAEDPGEANDLARVDKWRALYPAGGVRMSDRPPAGYTAPKLWAEAARIR